MKTSKIILLLVAIFSVSQIVAQENVVRKKTPRSIKIEYAGTTYEVMPKDIGNSTWRNAVDVCRDTNAFGYDDWYLPNKTELNALYINRDAIGGFCGCWYWSYSVHPTGDGVWSQNFDNGKKDVASTQNENAIRFRCIRKVAKD